MQVASETAVRASDFIQSIGVNAHLQETSSSYGTSDVAAQMAYLGIDNMRVSDYVGTALAEYQALGAAGVKFDLITVIDPQNSINLSTEMSYINQLASYTVSVEGPNEVNTDPVTYDGLTGVAAATAFQKDLYTAVHADSLLTGVKVLPFSLSVGGSVTGFGDVSAYADAANVHGYASDGVPPDYMLGYAVSSVTTVTGKPVEMTETGNYTLLNGGSGVNQDVQAKWLMDTLLENYSSGVVKTYIYQLEDGGTSTTDPENNYGLYTADGTPKQAAIDIHNLTTILADTGTTASTFTPTTLNYTVTGLDSNYGAQELFAKSDGSFDIALWSEPDFFDATTDVEEAVTPSTVTVALGGTYNIEVFDPVIGTSPIALYTSVSSVTVSLTTDPLIIEVSAVAAVAAPVAVRSQVAVSSATLGLTAGSSNTLTVDGSDWQSSGNVTVGLNGSGTFLIENTGTAIVGGTLTIGTQAGSSGVVSVGSGSTLTANAYAAIGNAQTNAVGSLTVAAGGTFDVARTLSIYSGSTLTLAGGTVSGGNTSNTVNLAIGATVSGNGALNVGDGNALIDNGKIAGTGGTLEIGNSVQGTGAVQIDAGATVKIDGSSITVASIAFMGSNGTLSLETGARVTSSITGFSAGDQILMSGIDAATWNATKGTLTLTDQGHTVDTLHLGGSYTGDVFNVAASNSGAVITVHTS